MACRSAHPITEAPSYTDLKQGVDGVRLDDFPSAIIDSLEWKDLPSTDTRKVGEEFHIAIKSDQKPYHLFRISKSRKNPGETILYWPKPEVQLGMEPDDNMRDYLNGMCEEFFTAGEYEYCIPLFSKEVNWKGIFGSLVNRNVWSVADGVAFQSDSADINSSWSMIFQVRSGSNYRTYQHSNPDNYTVSEETTDIMAIAVQLKNVADNFTPAQNYDVFTGITSGVRGTGFKPCNSEETWRFNGNISELISESGLPINLTEQRNLNFLLKVEGTIKDEWYAQRNNTGFTKVITPVHVNSVQVTSATECNE